MIFSIITINFNNVAGLKRTLRSTHSQKSKCFEHIVIDGGSDDGSVELLQTIKHDNFSYLSENDYGIYDALNKAIGRAKNRYILFVNSGDILYDDNVLTNFEKLIAEHPGIDAFYGTKHYANFSQLAGQRKITRVWKPSEHKRWKYLLGWMIPHQALMVKKNLFDKYGLFDTSFSIAGDYDWILRVFFVNKGSVLRCNNNVIIMEDGGVSNASMMNIMKSNLEVIISWKKYYKIIPIWIIFLKPLSKLIQLKIFKELN